MGFVTGVNGVGESKSNLNSLATPTVGSMAAVDATQSSNTVKISAILFDMDGTLLYVESDFVTFV